MRGLEEIIASNENPAAYYRGREPQHGLHVEGDTADYRSFATNLADKLRRAQNKPSRGDAIVAGILADLADHIFPQLDIDQPPFINFWANINAARLSAGLPEALYKEARVLFLGGETPVGAMTFIGKQWDGLRAVPVEPVVFLGDYLGEYRIVSDAGTFWHKVTNHGVPVVFKAPEAAIKAAEKVRNFRRHAEKVDNHGGMKSS